MKRVDSQTESSVIQLYKSGLSCKSIEKQIGINSVTAFNILKRHGVQTRTKGGIYSLPIDTLIKEYKSGVSITTLAKKYGVTDHTISNYLESKNVKRDNIYVNRNLNRDYFEIIDTYDKAYFLGLMFTDGNVGKNTNCISITLSEKDCKILEVFRDKTGNENPLKYLSRKNRVNREVTFHLKSEKMKMDLSQYGVVPNKTYSIKPILLSSELMSHFIRGLIDGDGWISYKSKQIGFCGNEEMVRFVRDYLVETLGVYKVKILHPEPNLWQITWAGKRNAEKIGSFLYKDKHDCFIERKFDNYLQLIS